jgi:hypothetical protein
MTYTYHHARSVANALAYVNVKKKRKKRKQNEHQRAMWLLRDDTRRLRELRRMQL